MVSRRRRRTLPKQADADLQGALASAAALYVSSTQPFLTQQLPVAEVAAAAIIDSVDDAKSEAETMASSGLILKPAERAQTLKRNSNARFCSQGYPVECDPTSRVTAALRGGDGHSPQTAPAFSAGASAFQAFGLSVAVRLRPHASAKNGPSGTQLRQMVDKTPQEPRAVTSRRKRFP